MSKLLKRQVRPLPPATQYHPNLKTPPSESGRTGRPPASLLPLRTHWAELDSLNRRPRERARNLARPPRGPRGPVSDNTAAPTLTRQRGCCNR